MFGQISNINFENNDGNIWLTKRQLLYHICEILAGSTSEIRRIYRNNKIWPRVHGSELWSYF